MILKKKFKHALTLLKTPTLSINKIGVNILQFGSKIDKNSSTLTEDIFTVKEVIIP